jgi:hypothetical protein
MIKVFKLLSKTTGLNTKVDPVEIEYNPENGVQDLAVAYNVDISDGGRLSRRKGFTQQVDADCHSVFCDGGACLYVTGDALTLLRTDYSTKALRNVQPGARMRYAQVDDETYYCNGWQTGRVASEVSMSWVMADTRYGPDTKREYSDPPVGTDVAFHAGRMWVAEGDTLWYSEPFGFNYFDLAGCYFKFNSQIRTVRPVKEGLFVSDEVATYYFRGVGDPKEYYKIKVADYPIVQYSDVKFFGKLVLYQGGEVSVDCSFGDLSAMWMSEKGICYGGYDGTFKNLTEYKIEKFPPALTGAGLFYRGNYIGLLDP